MKKFIFGIIAAAAMSISTAYGQPTVFEGCVGECGSVATTEFIPKGGPKSIVTYEIFATSNSLCPNTDAIVEVTFPLMSSFKNSQSMRTALYFVNLLRFLLL